MSQRSWTERVHAPLARHFLLEENQKSKFEFEYMKNIFPSIIIQYDFVKILIRSMANFIYLYIFRILVGNVTISISRETEVISIILQ